MADPVELLIQGAIVTRFKADAGIGALCGDRIYDRPPFDTANPPSDVFPFVTVGDAQVVDDTNSCSVMDEVFTRTHVWSRAPGKVEGKKIAGAIRDSLRTALTITGHTISENQHVNTRYMDDPDGLTTHAVVEHRFMTNPTS